MVLIVSNSKRKNRIPQPRDATQKYSIKLQYFLFLSYHSFNCNKKVCKNVRKLNQTHL